MRGRGRVRAGAGVGGRSGDVQRRRVTRFSDTLDFGTVFSSVWLGGLGAQKFETAAPDRFSTFLFSTSGPPPPSPNNY
jgi:hypothetical protein